MSGVTGFRALAAWQFAAAFGERGRTFVLCQPRQCQYRHLVVSTGTGYPRSSSFDVCFLQFFNVSAEYAKAQLLLRYPNEKRRHAEVPGLLCCDAVWLETESWMGELARAVSRWLLRLQPISSFFISVVAAAATAGHYTRAPSCRTRCAFCASGSGAGVSWKRSCDLCSGVRRRPAVLRPAIGQVWFARPLIGFFFGLSWCFCLSVLLWLASRACKSAAEWLLL